MNLDASPARGRAWQDRASRKMWRLPGAGSQACHRHPFQGLYGPSVVCRRSCPDATGAAWSLRLRSPNGRPPPTMGPARLQKGLTSARYSRTSGYANCHLSIASPWQCVAPHACDAGLAVTASATDRGTTDDIQSAFRGISSLRAVRVSLVACKCEGRTDGKSGCPADAALVPGRTNP